MSKRITRWALNLAVIISMVVLCINLPSENVYTHWQPYLVFIMANWLFADLLFRYIPGKLNLGPKKLPLQYGVDLVISICIAFVVYRFSTRFLFDDAGYVLRYIFNFQQGYFYKFNPHDPPVFGLSGFVYGCICFLISAFGFSPTTTVKIANLSGSIGYAFMLMQIVRILIQDKRLQWVVFITMALGIETIVLMFASGLELPVHITIILCTIYFFLKNRHKLFLLFAALSVISKLDALPLIAVLMVLYSWQEFVVNRSLKRWRDIVIFAGIPLLVWLIFTWLLFGSPLPQSAFAKYYYHPNPDKHSFPFLYYFLEHPIRRINIIAFEIFGILHLLEILYYRRLQFIRQFLFGWLFIAGMTMYYFYNPNERMIWYYSLSEFMLTIQVIYSLVYWTTKKPLNKTILLPLPVIIVLSMHMMMNMNNVLRYHNFYTERVERERFKIGEYMFNHTTANDTLMTSHGLVGWKSKGYVIDLTGLNSKLVTRYKRNPDSLIRDFKPHYIINHAWTHDLNIYGQNGFGIDTIFADVTLVDYPYWAIMKRVQDKKRGYAQIPLELCNNKYDVLDKSQVVRFYSDSLFIWTRDVPGRIIKLWTGIKREENSFTLDVTLHRDSTVMAKYNLWIEKGDENYVSKYVKGVSIPLEVNGTRADAVTIVPRGIYSFTCLGPLLEFVYE